MSYPLYLLKNLLKTLFPKKQNALRSDNIIVFKIKCLHCGKIVSVRINKDYDRQQDLDSSNGGYILKKEVQDSTCFRIMKLEARFNSFDQIIEKNITGGEFIEAS